MVLDNGIHSNFKNNINTITSFEEDSAINFNSNQSTNEIALTKTGVFNDIKSVDDMTIEELEAYYKTKVEERKRYEATLSDNIASCKIYYQSLKVSIEDYNEKYNRNIEVPVFNILTKDKDKLVKEDFEEDKKTAMTYNNALIKIREDIVNNIRASLR